MPSKKHWEQVYATKADDSVSWYQARAGVSLDLIGHAGLEKGARVIDVGGGASRLVDDLAAREDLRLSVLDISAGALGIARKRLGEQADAVNWIEGDITTVALPERVFDLWHDRAVFHFLTRPEDRQAYVRQLKTALKPGGQLIIATFGPDGPERCSGLPIVRYSPETLRAALDGAFELEEHQSEAHLTPSGTTQHFIYCRFRYTGG